MAAPKNNKNAEKWNFDTVMPILEKILNLALTEQAVYIGDALVQCGLYNDIWRHWKEMFKDNEIVIRTIKKIETQFENYLFKSALQGNVNPTVAIFGLKNNHKWTDKTESDVNLNGNLHITPLKFID